MWRAIRRSRSSPWRSGCGIAVGRHDHVARGDAALGCRDDKPRAIALDRLHRTVRYDRRARGDYAIQQSLVKFRGIEGAVRGIDHAAEIGVGADLAALL